MKVELVWLIRVRIKGQVIKKRKVCEKEELDKKIGSDYGEIDTDRKTGGLCKSMIKGSNGVLICRQ